MSSYAIIDLGPPVSTNSTGTTGASALNERGDTAGHSFYFGRPDPQSDEEGLVASVWNELGAGVLLNPPGVMSAANDVNDNGAVVGSYGTSPTQTQPGTYPKHGYAFRNGTMIDLGPILGTSYSVARAINNADHVVGWVADNSFAMRPFLYEAASSSPPQFISTWPEDDSALASDINNSGAIVGTSRRSGGQGTRGFVYNGGPGGGLVDLGPAVYVEKISDSGLVVGTIPGGPALSWAAAVCDSKDAQPQFQPITSLPSSGRGINDRGDVVGSHAAGGFLYQNGVMNNLNDLIPANSGWNLESGDDINNKGQILARGNYLGRSRACLLTPLPTSAWFSSKYAIVAQILFGVIQDGGGLIYVPGRGPVPIGPWETRSWDSLGPIKQDMLTAMAASQLSALMNDPDMRRLVDQAAIRVMTECVRKLKETA